MSGVSWNVPETWLCILCRNFLTIGRMLTKIAGSFAHALWSIRMKKTQVLVFKWHFSWFQINVQIQKAW